MEPDEFARQVKDALEHLYDPARLEVHPLLAEVVPDAVPDGITRAQKLRGILKDAIEALRPQAGSPSSSPAWRSYLALRYRYIQGMSMGEAADELGLSLRQLQRELRRGLDAMVALLARWRLSRSEVAPTPGQATGLRQELEQWKLSRQPCDVQALVDETLWMLRPLLAQGGATVQVAITQPLPPVLADSTLTRQALLQVLRLLALSAPAAMVTVSASPVAGGVDLLVESPSASLDASDEGWQTARLLMGQQGGVLAAEPMPEGGVRAIFRLPQVSQTRLLVIDDNPAIHQLFERYLAPHRYEVLHAEDGDTALRLAAEAQPDVITLDVMMPNIDGWHVLRELARQPATARIPVIVCSVLREPELALALGARAYLKKPVDRLDLLKALARFRPLDH
jgi:CheY-like chemotaxis protein